LRYLIYKKNLSLVPKIFKIRDKNIFSLETKIFFLVLNIFKEIIIYISETIKFPEKVKKETMEKVENSCKDG
jgi:hypothetical protein